MSTKTSIKRIALVVASALTLGGVSIIAADSASAALTPNAVYTTMYDTTNGYQVVGGQATLTLGVDSQTTTTITTSGVGSIVSYAMASNTGATETLTAVTGGFQYNPNSVRQGTLSAGNRDSITVVLTSAVAGSQTLTIQPLNSDGSPGTAVTKVVTWTASGTTAVSSVTSYLIDTTTGISSTAGLVDAVTPLSYDKGTAGTAANKAEAVFVFKDANGNAVNGATVTVLITGAGFISAGGTALATYSATTATQVATSITTGANGTAWVAIGQSGTAGVATVQAYVTLADGTKVTGTKSVTFTGSAATITPTSAVGAFVVGVNGKNANGGSAEDSSSAYAIKAKILDSAGGLVTSGSIWAKSSNTAVATVSGAAHTPSAGYVYILVTGVSVGKATITFQNTDPAGTTAPTVTGTVDITVNAALANSVTISTDLATYQPGQPGTVSITLKNADGTPVADGTYTVFGATTPLVSNLYLQGNSGGPNASAWSSGITSVTTTGGVASYDFYAPSVSGTLTFSGTTISATTSSSNLTAAARSVAATASATIAGAGGGDAALALDAANAATDAANNAYDEAQNATQAAQDALAAVTALAAQVKSLIASVKSLTALVSKIKAKVGA